MAELTRRRLLAGSGALAGAGLLHQTIPHGHPWEHEASAAEHQHGGGSDGGHAAFRGGKTVDHAANGFNPHEMLRDFDWGTTTRLASGRVQREWELYAVEHEIEIAPGVKIEGWTYNQRIPGPTLRGRVG